LNEKSGKEKKKRKMRKGIKGEGGDDLTAVARIETAQQLEPHLYWVF
jgi:hypothetical protein